MKRISFITLALVPMLSLAFSLTFVSCNDDEARTVWEDYAEWREKNNTWLAQQQGLKNPDGTPYYKTIVPNWDKSSFVLIHYFNDRAETEGNLSPLYTSTIDVRYKLHLYNGTAIDSSDMMTTNGAGIFRTRLDRVIPGWTAALSDMRVGDTAQVIIPYALAYGNTISEKMPPFSNLRFNIRLVDIPYYEASPY